MLNNSEVVFCIVKLILGGIAAFFAILLWSKNREAAWVCVAAGAVTGYAGIVAELLGRLGIPLADDVLLPGTSLPLLPLAFIVLPFAFVIAAFVLMILKSR